jgi:uncharacterized membrane protein YbhN (UPF0104 family)
MFGGRVQGRQVWLAAVSLAALALLGWFLARMHWEQAWEATRNASWSLILLAAVLLLVEWGVRAWRFYYLVGDVDPGVRFRDLWVSTTIGNAFNTFLPLRGGDLVRVAVLARRRGMSVTAVLAATGVEKLLDAVGIVGAVAVLLMWMPEGVGEGTLLTTLRSYAGWMGLGALGAMAIVPVLGSRPARRLVALALRGAPRAVRNRGLAMYQQLVLGLSGVGNPWRLVPALVGTVLIWVVGWAGIFALLEAYQLAMPPVAGLFVEVVVNVSVALPQAPGFVGVFQVALEKTLSTWGASVGAAEALALVLWACFFLPITVLGLIDALREGSGGLGSFRKDLLEDLSQER